jgi:PAS domain S-box-containing protein
MNNFLLELFRGLVVAYLIYTLIKAGKEKKHFPHNGWSLILSGFYLILLGSILDITDNFESLSSFVVIGNTEVQTFLKNVVGYSGGLLLLTIGLKEWLPFVAGVEELSEVAGRLATSNSKLQSQHAILYSNERRFRAIFDDATIGIATLTPNGHFDQANATFQRMLGYSNQELNGFHWTELASPEYLEASEHIFNALAEGRQERGKLKRNCWRKDGSKLFCQERLSAIRKGDEEPLSYYIVLTDDQNKNLNKIEGNGAIH